MKFTTYFYAIMLLLVPALTDADRGGGGGMSFEDGLFWGADLDRNENLNKDEAGAVYNLADDEIFKRYDEDGDGVIIKPEFHEFIQQSPWTKKFGDKKSD